MSGETLFISDLHLSADARPGINALFFRFLEREAGRVDALYILGDLFEVWIGDDDLTGLHLEVAQALATAAAAGTAVHLMHGNRDFLLGEHFAGTAGCTLLPDPSLVPLPGGDTLLLHGDTLCTDDLEYQAFRARVRDPATQAQFLSLPLEQRRVVAQQFRHDSFGSKAGKSMEIMDVTEEAVAEAFRAHPAATRMIHGHTHRPGHHRHRMEGREVERWVLGAWYEEGYVLRVSAEGWREERLPATA